MATALHVLVMGGAMRRFHLEAGFIMTGGSVEERDEMTDRVMEELLNLGVQDPSVGGSLTSGEVQISLTLNASTKREAISKANALMRTAIHAAGGATPGWPTLSPEGKPHAELIDA
jgi:hypothetical protein